MRVTCRSRFKIARQSPHDSQAPGKDEGKHLERTPHPHPMPAPRWIYQTYEHYMVGKAKQRESQAHPPKGVPAVVGCLMLGDQTASRFWVFGKWDRVLVHRTCRGLMPRGGWAWTGADEP